ncbi:ThiF family adenylyltransferase [Methanoregula sp.]|uniref:ThiF family adenylyltransferase n=1 Tax=Methanoregula sp. TaxID=2052170 RepID=UPI003569F915
MIPPKENDTGALTASPGIARDRYCRQSILPEIGLEGQRRLGESRAVIVGLGAMGSSVANTLVRAGVGHVVLIDRDLVELHNLQRQILYSEEDVDRPKAVAAAEILHTINSSVEVEARTNDLNVLNAEKLLTGADIILDGTDNLQTRFLINDVCVKYRIPWVYAGAVGTGGMVMPIVPGRTPCFRCLVPSLPGPGLLQTCDIAGVLNTIPTIIASLECTLAFQILTGRFESGEGTAYLVHVDAWRQTFDRMEVGRRADCPCCGKGQLDFLNAVSPEMVTSLCGRDAIQITPATAMEISLEELESRLSRLGEVRSTRYMLTFKSGTEEISIFRDGRAIIKGTKDEAAARSLYARYIGL